MPEQLNDLEGLSIEEVLQLVESGDLTAAVALELEQQGKNRKTLIAQLEKLLEPNEPEKQEDEKPSSTPSPQPSPETVRVVFVKNTKHNKTLYKAGQRADVSQEDYDILLAAKTIRPVEE